MTEGRGQRSGASVEIICWCNKYLADRPRETGPGHTHSQGKLSVER